MLVWRRTWGNEGRKGCRWKGTAACSSAQSARRSRPGRLDRRSGRPRPLAAEPGWGNSPAPAPPAAGAPGRPRPGRALALSLGLPAPDAHRERRVSGAVPPLASSGTANRGPSRSPLQRAQPGAHGLRHGEGNEERSVDNCWVMIWGEVPSVRRPRQVYTALLVSWAPPPRAAGRPRPHRACQGIPPGHGDAERRTSGRRVVGGRRAQRRPGAVFPAAGLQGRACSRRQGAAQEMINVVDKPVIQYGVEEAVAAGLTQMILVTAARKGSIEDHFDASPELERLLELKEHADPGPAEAHRRYGPDLLSTATAPLGLGHAVLLTKAIVGDEPFAVFLPDDIFEGGDDPCMRQLLRVFARFPGPVIAVGRCLGRLALRRAGGQRGGAEALPGVGHGGKAQAGGSPIRPGHHGSVRPHPGDLWHAGANGDRGRGRDPANGRAEGPAPAASHLRLRVHRQAL